MAWREVAVGRFRVEVDWDEEAENPRDYPELCLATLASWGRRDRLGEVRIDSAQFETKAAAAASLGRCVAILPLYLYDHSGISIATTPFGCQWDSCQVGFAYISGVTADERGLHGPNWPPERYYDVIRDEVARCDAWLTGEIYRYQVFGLDGEIIDVGGGFYDPNSALEAGWVVAEEAEAAMLADLDTARHAIAQIRSPQEVHS